jgi:CBS domain-containing protein
MRERSVFECICHRHVVTVLPHVTVLEAARVMTAPNCNNVLIVDLSGAMLGILTEHDLLERVLAKDMDPKTVLVTEVMTRHLHTVEPEVKVADAVVLMMEHGINHLPVLTSESKILGVFSARDALPRELDDGQSLAKFNDQLNDALA